MLLGWIMTLAAASAPATDVTCADNVMAAGRMMSGQPAEIVDRSDMLGEVTARLTTMRPEMLGMPVQNVFVTMKPRSGILPTPFDPPPPLTPQLWTFVLPDGDFGTLSKRFIATYNPKFGRTDFNCYGKHCGTGLIAPPKDGALKSAELKYDRRSPGGRTWLPASDTLILECTYATG